MTEFNLLNPKQDIGLPGVSKKLQTCSRLPVPGPVCVAAATGRRQTGETHNQEGNAGLPVRRQTGNEQGQMMPFACIIRHVLNSSHGKGQGSGVRGQGSGIRDQGSGVGIQSLEVQGSRFKVQGSEVLKGEATKDINPSMNTLKGKGTKTDKSFSGKIDLLSKIDSQKQINVEGKNLLEGSALKVSKKGSGVRDQGSGVRDQGSGVGIQSLEIQSLEVQGSRFKVQGSRLKAQGSGVKVQGSEMVNTPGAYHHISFHSGGSSAAVNESVNSYITEPRALFNQIATAAKMSGRVRITLNPPHLGTLDVDVLVRDNKVHVILQLENNNVKQILQSNVENLKSSLRNHGLVADTINVLVQEKTDSANYGANYKSGQNETLFKEGRNREGHEEDHGGFLNHDLSSLNEENQLVRSDGRVSLFV